MPAIDELIGKWVRQAERSGELQKNPHLGKPFDLDDGFDHTPEELRMTHRILKQAGYLPAEVPMSNKVAELTGQLRAASDEGERSRVRAELVKVQTRLALLLERYRRR
jgi:hypothetical protein